MYVDHAPIFINYQWLFHANGHYYFYYCCCCYHYITILVAWDTMRMWGPSIKVMMQFTLINLFILFEGRLQILNKHRTSEPQQTQKNPTANTTEWEKLTGWVNLIKVIVVILDHILMLACESSLFIIKGSFM